MNTPRDVLFVCQHGAAKSVIAARYFSTLARARGMTVDAAAAGIEPDDAIPPHVIAGLRNDGIHVDDTPPQGLTPEMLKNARLVISFGCDLSGFNDAAAIVQWPDVPAVSDGYDASRTVIVDRLNAILDQVSREVGNDRRERPGPA